MQVTVEDQNSVKKILHIEIPEDDVARELDKAYGKLKKTAKIKGFRPGKAPRVVLERLFKKDVHVDVISKLINDSFIEAVKETNLPIISKPEIEPPELKEKGPYKYAAAVELRPELDDIEFKGLNLKKQIYKVTENEVDLQLKMFQENLAELKKIDEDRPAQQDDFLLIDYEGFKDGKPFAETEKTENYSLKIGANKILKEFDEQLIGMNPGEQKEIKVSFPENYFNKKLANLEITFQVSLKEIQKYVFPEINDEFAKKLGKYETLDELKSEIGKHLETGHAKRVEQGLSDQVFDKLREKVKFEIPDVMVDYELSRIISEAERSFDYQNMSMEQIGYTREALANEYRDMAGTQARNHLIIGKVIDQEKLELSDEEIEDGYKELSQVINQPAGEIKKYYKKNDEQLRLFQHSLLEKKAIRLIINNSNIEEIEPEAEKEKADVGPEKAEAAAEAKGMESKVEADKVEPDAEA